MDRRASPVQQSAGSHPARRVLVSTSRGSSHSVTLRPSGSGRAHRAKFGGARRPDSDAEAVAGTEDVTALRDLRQSWSRGMCDVEQLIMQFEAILYRSDFALDPRKRDLPTPLRDLANRAEEIRLPFRGTHTATPARPPG
jgi:hypothetical protein